MMMTNLFKCKPFLGYIPRNEINIVNSSYYYVARSNKQMYEVFEDSDHFVFYSRNHKLHVSSAFVYDYDLFYIVQTDDENVNMHPAFVRKYPTLARKFREKYYCNITKNVLKGCVHEFSDEEIEEINNFINDYSHYKNSYHYDIYGPSYVRLW